MDTIVDALSSFFGILVDTNVLGMPILVWAIIPVVLSLVISFLKGKKQ